MSNITIIPEAFTSNKQLYAVMLIAVLRRCWPGLMPVSPDAVRCRAGPGPGLL